MKSDQHNYKIIDDTNKYTMISRNSHSACYAYVSYTTAYLKAHYPEEYMTSYINALLRSKKGDKYEKVEQFEKECVKMGMEMLPRSVNKCKWNYEIESKRDPDNGVFKSQIRPSLRCKGMSARAAKNIEENQPFEDIRSFAFKTSPSKVDSKSVECLSIAGFFREKDSKTGKIKKRKSENVLKEFSELREDMKSTSRKGLESHDLFEGI